MSGCVSDWTTHHSLRPQLVKHAPRAVAVDDKVDQRARKHGQACRGQAGGGEARGEGIHCGERSGGLQVRVGCQVPRVIAG